MTCTESEYSPAWRGEEKLRPGKASQRAEQVVEYLLEIVAIIDRSEGVGGRVRQDGGHVLIQREIGGALAELAGDDGLSRAGGVVGGVIGIVAQGDSAAQRREQQVLAHLAVQHQRRVGPLPAKRGEGTVAQAHAREERQLGARQPGIRQLQNAGKVAEAARGDGGELERFDLAAILANDQRVGGGGRRGVGPEGEAAAQHRNLLVRAWFCRRGSRSQTGGGGQAAGAGPGAGGGAGLPPPPPRGRPGWGGAPPPRQPPARPP